MKKILGLDLGTNSIGWAVVNEAENGNRTTFETYRLRAKAATTEISLAEFARVLLQINNASCYWGDISDRNKELTPELKKEIRDVVVFYQRPLKSQKGLISFCEFESRQNT